MWEQAVPSSTVLPEHRSIFLYPLGLIFGMDNGSKVLLPHVHLLKTQPPEWQSLSRGQRCPAAAPPLPITWATGLRLVGISPSPQAMICMSRDTVLCRHLDSDKHNTTQHQKAPTCLNKPRKHDIKIKLPTCFETSRYHYLKTALNFYIPIKSGNWDCKNRNLSIPGKQKQKLHTCHSPLRSQ